MVFPWLGFEGTPHVFGNLHFDVSPELILNWLRWFHWDGPNWDKKTPCWSDPKTNKTPEKMGLGRCFFLINIVGCWQVFGWFLLHTCCEQTAKFFVDYKSPVGFHALHPEDLAKRWTCPESLPGRLGHPKRPFGRRISCSAAAKSSCTASNLRWARWKSCHVAVITGECQEKLRDPDVSGKTNGFI